MAGSVSFDRAAEFYDATRGYDGNTAELIRDALVQYIGADKATRFLEMGWGRAVSPCRLFRQAIIIRV